MRWSFLLLLVLAFSVASALAQDPGEAKAAVSNLPGAQYPRVYADGRVAFRLAAAKASTVQLAGAIVEKPVEMTKGENGVWMVTIPAPAPGFHYYWFLVDGV